VPGLRSIYRWQGAVHDDTETLAVIKTTRACLPALLARLPALHPYDVPEALALPVVAGHAPYLAWVGAETAIAPDDGATS
jgi:periplasmic divalent cation tolerance protein